MFKAWFVLGKLGGFNSENMQVQANFEVSNRYDMGRGESDARTCVFHAMGGPEYNSKYCRAWFDLGSADEMCVDVHQLAHHLQPRIFRIKTMGGRRDAPRIGPRRRVYVDDSGEMDVMMETGPSARRRRGPPQGGMSR